MARASVEEIIMSKKQTGIEIQQPQFHKSAVPFIFVCVFLLCGTVFGQSVYVKASIDRNKILIGEPIRLSLEASVPQGQNASWFAVDSIPGFDIIERSKIDSTIENGDNLYRQNITITSFDSGRWVIPSLALENNGRNYLTDSIPVSVAFSNFDPSQPYHDIKDILPVTVTDQRLLFWGIVIVTILSLLVVIYLLRKPVEKIFVAEKKFKGSATAYEQAMKELEELRAQNLPQSGQVKTYYTGMNDILRNFITRKHGVPVLEKTSGELSLMLKDRNMPNEVFINLAQALRMSDAVKFAKFVPRDQDNDESYGAFKKSIELLNN